MPGRPTALVTGASAGIGLYTALGLARAGFRVLIAGRDAQRPEAARRFVATRVKSAELAIALADFADLTAVRALAAEILARYQQLDVLVNNAGLISPRRAISAQG